MLVREVIERLQELDPEAEVEAYIIPVPLFRAEEVTEKKPSRSEVKQGYWPDKLRHGDKIIHHSVQRFRPRCVLMSDYDYNTVEDYSAAIHVSFDEGLRRLLSFAIKALCKLDRKEWKSLDWFR